MAFYSFIFLVAAEKVIKENLQIVCVPTSFQAQMLIVKNNLVLRNLDECTEVSLR